MTTLAQSIARPRSRPVPALLDAGLVVAGSLVMVGLSHLAVRLPFTPVPVTGQTLGVLLVGASLGTVRGAAAIALFLVYGIAGLPAFAGGASGVHVLLASSATGGYLWGFLLAAALIGRLAERGWDRTPGRSLLMMAAGEVVIFACGVAWLAAALSVSAGEALRLGFYPFVIGDAIKLVLAAGLLPAAWRVVGRR